MLKQNLINLAHKKLSSWLSEPSWLQNKRQQALKSFQDFDLPSRKNELWKYTDIKRLERTDIDVKNNISVDELTLQDNEILIVVDNKGFVLSDALPDGISICDWVDSEESQWQSVSTDKERIFIDLNTAMLNSGFVLNVDKSSQVNIHIHYQQSNQDWNNIRTVINLAENAHVNLKESYATECLINHVSLMNLAKNSNLHLECEKILASGSALINYSKISCEDNCFVKQSTINKNGYFSHHIQDIYFNSEHSEVLIGSTNLSEQSAHIADNIHINHLSKNCKSEVIMRSLANDKGQVSVNAKAVVAVAADGSDIAQSLKNILMTDDAKIYSKPELEINTDDVVAAHGSTIGELDDLALTYLRSRGISYDEAQKMLIQSFLQDANIFKQEDFIQKIDL
jgi:Fe-S cluster assembly protein SufD